MEDFEDLLQTPFEKLPKVDEIGPWSLVKLDIVKRYAEKYSLIIKQQQRFSHVYIDAFSGAGIAKLKKTEKYVLGSPLNALNVSPPFDHYYFIDLDGEKIDFLRDATKDRSNVSIEVGDCNSILLEKIFPKVKYTDFKRGLCLLDPYGLHLDWKVLLSAASAKSIEVFINFPMMDINMNVLWRKNPEGQDPLQIERMNLFWGDDSWRDVAYDTESDLFGHPSKYYDSNRKIALAFKDRLKKIAGFKHVPDPIPMRNTSQAELYYLFFASHKKAGYDIARYLFEKYTKFGASGWQQNQK